MIDFDDLWGGNWRIKLLKLLRKAGHQSLQEFLMVNQGKTYWDLANELGPKCAPMQVFILQAEQADSKSEIRYWALDSLLRQIRHYFPSGWGVSRKPDFQASGIIVDWRDFFLKMDEGYLRVANDIWKVIQSEALHGWIPQNNDDPFLNGIFDRYWNS